MKWSPVLIRIAKGGLGTALLLFCAVLVISFYGVFLPHQTLFSNDGPLGRLMSQSNQLPERFLGCWEDLNSVGFNGGAASPGISFGLQWLLGPVWFSKFYTVLSLLILGVGAWCFFRQCRLAPLACILGGLAMISTSTLFSLACWGLGAQVIAAGMSLLALAILADPTLRPRWLLLILAGFAVGMAVTEGADVGALFSLLIAAFAAYQAWIAESSRIKNLAIGAGRLALIVVCAVFLAAQTIHGLISTSIEGVNGTQQDSQTKAQRWGWATQWSLPKTETLGLVVPGLFGFRMDTPGGGEYWGLTGHDAAWDKPVQGSSPRGLYRYTGGGNYIGLLVVLLALWAAAQSLRPKNSVFNPDQKKWVWFWLVIGIASLLLAYGRYAPFYRLIYALPYVSTIRNPTKFLYILSIAVVTLFAFGIDGLWRKYMNADDQAGNWKGLQSWWNKTGTFEKKWVWGCALVWIAALAAWYVYAQQAPALEKYLGSVQVDQPTTSIAHFSIRQSGWFILFFFMDAGVLVLILSGAFMGKRAATGVVLLAILLLADLGLANRPWIEFWNYPFKYASNPVIDLLRDKPYEHRVVLAPISWPAQTSYFKLLYKDEWLEQLFPFYGVQTFEVVEMPRAPKDYAAFASKLNVNPTLAKECRGCQLTDTHYILGPAEFSSYWNQQLPGTPLQTLMRFNLAIKPGFAEATNLSQLTAIPNNYGAYAMFDLASALPRAKLYSQWVISTNNSDVLDQMFSPGFNPANTVFVVDDVPTNSTPNATNPPDSAVQIVSYAPKDVVLKADATTPSILLLNDHYHPDWKVTVDGEPEKLLRCNYLMRGVYLLPGIHTIEFKFLPAVGLLWVSLAADILALAGLGIFIVFFIKSRPAVPAPIIQPVTQPAAQSNSNKSKPVSNKKRKQKVSA